MRKAEGQEREPIRLQSLIKSSRDFLVAVFVVEGNVQIDIKSRRIRGVEITSTVPCCARALTAADVLKL